MADLVKPCKKCGCVERYADRSCKACKKKTSEKWRRENREKDALRMREYRKKNPEKVAEIEKKYRTANKIKRSICSATWNNANKERVKINRKKWYEMQREHILQLQKAWRKANPEKVREMNIKKGHNRRAKIQSCGGQLSKGIVATLLERQNGKCACCGVKLNGEYHLDHIMPLALGGKNADDNVQLLLPKCNLKKGAKHPVDYMRERGLLL